MNRTADVVLVDEHAPSLGDDAKVQGVSSKDI
jgi:hypothetical protein